MKYRWLHALLLASISLFAFAKARAQDGNSSIMLQPPTTAKQPKVTDINGDRLADNYFWLRAKSTPAVIAHLAAEMAYPSAMMKPTEALQETLNTQSLS